MSHAEFMGAASTQWRALSAEDKAMYKTQVSSQPQKPKERASLLLFPPPENLACALLEMCLVLFGCARDFFVCADYIDLAAECTNLEMETLNSTFTRLFQDITN